MIAKMSLLTKVLLYFGVFSVAIVVVCLLVLFVVNRMDDEERNFSERENEIK